MDSTYFLKLKQKSGILFVLVVLFCQTRVSAQCVASYSYSNAPNSMVQFNNTSPNINNNTHFYWYHVTNPNLPWFSSPNLFSTNINANLTFTSNGYKLVCLVRADSSNQPYCFTSRCDTLLVLNAATPTTSSCFANFTRTKGPNGSVTFTSMSTGSIAGAQYTWSFGTGSVGYITAGSVASATFGTNGLKYVCLNVKDTVTGCDNTRCDTIFISNAISNGTCAPTVMFNMTKDSTQAFTWNAWPNYPNNVTGATWNWGDGSSSTNLYPSHTYSAAGLYSICVTVSVSCGTVTAQYCYVANIFKSSQDNSMLTVNVRQSIPTGMQHQTAEIKELRVFPNPGKGEFTLLLAGSDRENIELTVYNLLGEKVFAKQYAKQDQLNLDLNHLSSGQYYVQASSQSGNYYKKIVIQK